MDKRLLGLYSFLSSLIGISLIFILGFLQSGYSHVAQTISELGSLSSPYALIMNAVVFPMIGSSVIALGLGLHYGVKQGKGLFIGLLFLLVSGFSIALIGVFPIDFAYLHEFFVSMAFLSMIVSQLAFYFRLRNHKKWIVYGFYSLTTAIITIILSFIYKLIFISAFKGLMQRVSMAASFIWVGLMSVKLMKLK